MTVRVSELEFLEFMNSSNLLYLAIFKPGL
jgi:hypothetical protein